MRTALVVFLAMLAGACGGQEERATSGTRSAALLTPCLGGSVACDGDFRVTCVGGAWRDDQDCALSPHALGVINTCATCANIEKTTCAPPSLGSPLVCPTGPVLPRP